MLLWGAVLPLSSIVASLFKAKANFFYNIQITGLYALQQLKFQDVNII